MAGQRPGSRPRHRSRVGAPRRTGRRGRRRRRRPRDRRRRGSRGIGRCSGRRGGAVPARQAPRRACRRQAGTAQLGRRAHVRVLEAPSPQALEEEQGAGSGPQGDRGARPRRSNVPWPPTGSRPSSSASPSVRPSPATSSSSAPGQGGQGHHARQATSPTPWRRPMCGSWRPSPAAPPSALRSPTASARSSRWATSCHRPRLQRRTHPLEVAARPRHRRPAGPGQPGRDAPPADRRRHRLGQVVLHQLDAHIGPHAGHADQVRLILVDPKRVELGALQRPAPPAHPGRRATPRRRPTPCAGR